MTTILLLLLALLVRWIDWLADMMHLLILEVVTNSQRKQLLIYPTHLIIMFQQQRELNQFPNDRSGLMRLKIIDSYRCEHNLINIINNNIFIYKVLFGHNLCLEADAWKRFSIRYSSPLRCCDLSIGRQCDRLSLFYHHGLLLPSSSSHVYAVGANSNT